ncbi:ATP-binding protein [Roseobacter sp. HKCCA0434]|uniref:sensor histidine kinase n=1 Tax=Roseobacter sp. HKCCA0434 TaxID=3079297 RepID=UPI00290580E4|nr:ATP-binding protein [Roseobacter sp. HKCCA0434]
MSETAPYPGVARLRALSRTQLVLAALALVVGFVALWISWIVLTDRFMSSLSNRAAVRSTLYANAIEAELDKYTVASALLAQDRLLLSALTGATTEQTRLTLGGVQSTTGALSLSLYTAAGSMVADTQTTPGAINHAAAPYFQLALEQDISVFATVAVSETEQRFFFARRLQQSGTILGVVVLEVDLAGLQTRWVGGADQVFVTNAEDLILLSSRADWRYRSLSPFLDPLSAEGAGRFAILPMLNLDPEGAGPKVAIEGEEFLRIDRAVDFRGWRVTYLAPVSEARERVSAVVALELMGMSLLVALGFYIISRRAAKQSLRLQRESEELRALNARLGSEIEERLRVEQSLQEAESSLEQSSRLAALGQMSAAVSHELNQPLAAMRTYIAGAQLLMKRHRTEEALTSFARIEDLITRMGTITNQLKTFARKGTAEFATVDMRDSVTAALAMMAPQIGQSRIEIVRRLPDAPVLVEAEPTRLEQVLVNLLRNAVDAMRAVPEPVITIEMFAGPQLARLQVRDTGPGLPPNTGQIFEPFYTTKAPGEGVGLGLAISAGIIRDFGGTLTARNSAEGGAIFEVSLPLFHEPDHGDPEP